MLKKNKKIYDINLLTYNKRSFIDLKEFRDLLLELTTTNPELLDNLAAASVISMLDSINSTYRNTYPGTKDTVEVDIPQDWLLKLLKDVRKKNQIKITSPLIIEADSYQKEDAVEKIELEKTPESSPKVIEVPHEETKEAAPKSKKGKKTSS